MVKFCGRPALKAVKVSYASSDVARDSDFYVGVLGATEELALSYTADYDGASGAPTTRFRSNGARARPAAPAPTAPAPAPEPSMGDILDLDDIHVEFAPDLVNMVLDPGEGLDARIANMRRHVATRYGLMLARTKCIGSRSIENIEHRNVKYRTQV